ncbi:MAG: NlpC/P60 family protein [Mycobacteriaceae bacterium]
MGVVSRLRAVVTVMALTTAVATGVVVGQAQAQDCQPYGAIGDYWQSQGADSGWLSSCRNDENSVPGGRVEAFVGGAIYWSPQTGARSVKGAIRSYFNTMGASASFLGLPVTHETPTPTWVGAFNHFQGGSIYWSPASGVHEVHGAIRDAWAGQSWERDWLGFPTSDEYSVDNGRRSDFQGGSIVWDSRTNTTSFVRSGASPARTPAPPPALSGGAPSVGAPSVGASSVGARALAVALTKTGAPYVWGGNGPNVFDCSGLTSWAYRQVGITIPRVADDQARAGTYVSRDNLQAGDLVFFYNPVSHVGIYDGNGNVLNAPDVGQNVKLTPLQYMPYTTARRYG